MRVLTLLGSPRVNGNTSHVLNWVEQSLRSQAHTIERITLIQHKIGPCMECGHCRTALNGKCACENDECNAVLDRIVRAQAIILASPVFCWGFPSHTKALLDRMYCLVDDYEQNADYASRLAGKPMGLVVTCGGAEEANAELMIRGFYSLVRFLKGIPVGQVLYPFFRTPADLTQHDRNRATEFALRMVADR
jgi:multimeric flavodoxin WrbA